MKSEQQTSRRGNSRIRTPRSNGSAWSQLSLLVVPTIVALAVGGWTFASLGDLVLSMILGCVAFITVTPPLASMSDRDGKRRRHGQ
nr:hypothetical protein [Sphingomonas sp. Y57]